MEDVTFFDPNIEDMIIVDIPAPIYEPNPALMPSSAIAASKPTCTLRPTPTFSTTPTLAPTIAPTPTPTPNLAPKSIVENPISTTSKEKKLEVNYEDAIGLAVLTGKEPLLQEPALHLYPTPPSHKIIPRHPKDIMDGFEWGERKRFHNLLRKWFKDLPTIVKDLTLYHLISNPTTLPSFRDADPRELSEKMGPPQDESIWVKDRDGRGLVLFFKNALNQPFKEEQPRLAHVMNQAVETLISRYKPPKPSATDYRHKHFQNDSDYKGVYHFALWVPRGQEHGRNPKHPTPHHAVLSRDVIDRGYKFDAVMQFYKAIGPVIQSIGIWFEMLDPDAYARYHENWEYFANQTPLRALRVTKRQCFLGTAVLRGVQVGIHTDKGDVRDGWVAMVCTGEFTGGELCMPGLGLKLAFRPGDIIFFRSSLLEHFVADFVGERTSMVFFSHENLMDKHLGEWEEYQKGLGSIREVITDM